MEDSSTQLSMTRRTVFAAGALGALSMVALSAGEAQAAGGMTDEEKANVKVVNDYLAALGDSPVSPDKLVSFVTDDCSLRLSDAAPPMVGKAVALEGFKKTFGGGMRVPIKTSETHAKGPVVMNVRVDTIMIPGKPEMPIDAVGVFLLKDGKIKEWVDYIIPKKKA